MTTTAIKEKLDAAVAKVEKRERTTQRLVARANKLRDKMVKNGWSLTDRFACRDLGDDAYWAFCDYTNLMDDIKESEKKFAELVRIRDKWSAKYYESVKVDSEADELPEPIKQMIEELTETWTQYDIKRRDKYISDRRTMGYREFNAKYRTKYPCYTMTDEEIRVYNAESAKDFAVDLMRRVKDAVGTVTNYDRIYFNGNALNGRVEGTDGEATVETIIAGGYNIQRAHYRVLVHKIRRNVEDC